jgi:hypothetical protein
MRTILWWAGTAALATLGWSADLTTPAKKATASTKTVAKSAASATTKKAAPSKTGVSKGAAASGTTASHSAVAKAGSRTAVSHPGATKAGSRTTNAPRPATARAGVSTAASRRGKKGPPAKRVTWRNRQLAPTPQRYKEIQAALASKGYLNPEDANGTWNQASMDALKKFQAGQNLDSTGKINSLSLIALGLGPRRETAPPKPPAESPAAPPPDRQ